MNNKALYCGSDKLYHHGIKGQKWGIRRFQNEDGSYTAEGKRRRKNDSYSNKFVKKGAMITAGLLIQYAGLKLEGKGLAYETEIDSTGNLLHPDASISGMRIVGNMAQVLGASLTAFGIVGDPRKFKGPFVTKKHLSDSK